MTSGGYTATEGWNLQLQARVERQEKEAAAFVEFVLRHTLPERAAAHGAEMVHDIIKHHPFAKAHGPTKALSERGSNEG